MQDDISRAVLAREDVARYLKPGHGLSEVEARQRVEAYLDELRTTQRYTIYRALKHPLYPILRKVERIGERVDVPRRATAEGRVVYVSNHKSHLDYLVEPLILDDAGIRPPIITAGANLFGGALGLIHRHVTGAIPIRRNAKDPAYLATLKAYVAEMLKRHDLLVYLEGGRSYSGEIKSPKTGLLHAVMEADLETVQLVPMAVAYDMVLEDKILARQGTKRAQRPFTRELAEMIGAAVGYQSRAFVTFGQPLPLADWAAGSRREVLQLAKDTLATIGGLYKVLPSAIVAGAVRPSTARRDLVDHVTDLVGLLAARGANLAAADPDAIVTQGLEVLEARGIVVVEQDVVRVRERHALRYYARTIEHHLPPQPHPARTH